MSQRVLGEISGNSTKRRELSFIRRKEIIVAHDFGANIPQISKYFSVPSSTVHDTIKKRDQRPDQRSKRRPGRPKKYSERDERIISRFVRKNPKATYQDVLNAIDVQISRSTLKRILTKLNITNWLSKKRPKLTEEHAAKRLAWALKNKHTPEWWTRVIWTDECSVEQSSGKQRQWCFIPNGQAHLRWDKDFVTAVPKSKGTSVMVWGAIWGRNRSNIYILERDFESKKMGYSAESYIKVLKENLPEIYASLPSSDYLFMQDNAPIHTAKKSIAWLADNNIQMLEDWPPYSPDLNPIEHVWWELKKKAHELFPSMSEFKKNKESTEAIEAILKLAWQAIDRNLIIRLIDSMVDRVQAVIDAEGWYTKY